MADWKKSSFLFGSTDMYTTYGIQLTQDSIPQDVLLPGLRERKVTVPLRSGAYDYGAHYYDERAIQIECVTTRVLSRAQSRDIAYTLSKKSSIRFWTEPEKYYTGRIYQAPNLEQIRNIGFRFPLVFICDPFAVGETVEDTFTGNRYVPNYIGTAPSPTYIIIENTGSRNAVNIQIKQISAKES